MPFRTVEDQLLLDGVRLQDVADQFGTPVFVYSWQDIRAKYLEMQEQAARINGSLYYAVKANSNLSILNRLASLGAGFDIVSGGELERVIAAGGDPQNVIFSGVGKSTEEIGFAIKVRIKSFSVESASELLRIRELAQRLHIRANVLLRLNPDISVDTHPYIATGMKENKFGMPLDEVERLYREYQHDAHVNLQGLACHIGSQISTSEPYLSAVQSVLALIERLEQAGCSVNTLDLGGGFAIRYADEIPFNFEQFITELTTSLASSSLEIGFEPGRSLVADAGVLLTRIEYCKPAVADEYKNFLIVDAAMNDLIRPPLYDAYHEIEPISERSSKSPNNFWDVVGPVCESADFLGKDRALNVNPGDVLAIKNAGAYGFSLSSNYNSRKRAAEVLVDEDRVLLIRERESFDDLIRHERIV